MEGGGGGVGQANAVALVIEAGHTAVAVAGQGDVVDGDSVLAQGVHQLVGGGLQTFRVGAGGDIDVAAPADQLHPLLQKLLLPGHVGGQQVFQGHIGVVQHIENRVQTALTVAHVHHHKAGLGA